MKILKKKTLKSTNGITLIALVITIIVLLILAGISISMLSGDNSILQRATDAKHVSEEAQIKEKVQLAYLAAISERQREVNKDNLIVTLDYEFGTGKYELLEDLSGVTIDGKNYLFDGTITPAIPKEYSSEIKEKLKTDPTASLAEKKSPYVTYNGKMYRVLYDADSEYGWIEIISENPLKTVLLGTDDTSVSPEDFIYTGTVTTFDGFKNAAASYNRAITTLNEATQEYLTNITDRARCVGSNPSSPEDIMETTYTNSYAYMETYSWNNRFKVADTNYTKDKNQMDALGLTTFSDKTISSSYWLASRNVDAYSSQSRKPSKSYNLLYY